MKEQRLNGVIGKLSEGRPAVLSWASSDPFLVQALADQKVDGILFDLEHDDQYDIRRLADALQYLLDRRQILEAGTLAPSVVPLVRIAANGSEYNQWMAKQVLDLGPYGIVFPHVSTVDEARSAVSACRYARPVGSPRYDPAGRRSDQPTRAARYWGISNSEYRSKADVWPLADDGEILVVIQIESAAGIQNLDEILQNVPGIGAVLIGEGDLSADLGHPRDYDHPSVVSAITEVVDICTRNSVTVAHAHIGSENVASAVANGYKLLITEADIAIPDLSAMPRT